MFTLGTAFGAGVGGAVVATSASGSQGLAQAIGIVFAIMAVVALLSVVVGWRVPRGPSEQPARGRTTGPPGAARAPLTRPEPHGLGPAARGTSDPCPARRARRFMGWPSAPDEVLDR